MIVTLQIILNINTLFITFYFDLFIIDSFYTLTLILYK